MKNSEIYFNFGRWAQIKTQQLVPFCTNGKEISTIEQRILLNIVRNKQTKSTKKQIISWNLFPEYKTDYKSDALDRYLNLVSTQKNKWNRTHHSDGSFISDIEKIEKNAKDSVQNRIGNCGEQSAVAFMLLAEANNNDVRGVYVERFAISKPGDHCFVVIGRERFSDPRDPSTWGENAVICDPWGEVTFIVKEELNKRKKSPMLNYIVNILKDKNNSVSIISGHIGQGHTDRWKKKNNQDIKTYPDFQYHLPLDNKKYTLLENNLELNQDIRKRFTKKHLQDALVKDLRFAALLLKYCLSLRNELLCIIKTGDNLSMAILKLAFETFSAEESSTVYEAIKHRLPGMITTFNSLSFFLKILPKDNFKTATLSIMHASIPLLLRDPHNFMVLSDILSETQLTIVLDALRDSLPNLISTAYDLCRILDRLSSQQQLIVLESIKEKIFQIIKNKKDVKIICGHLSTEQCAIFFHVLKEQYIQFISRIELIEIDFTKKSTKGDIQQHSDNLMKQLNIISDKTKEAHAVLGVTFPSKSLEQTLIAKHQEIDHFYQQQLYKITTAENTLADVVREIQDFTANFSDKKTSLDIQQHGDNLLKQLYIISNKTKEAHAVLGVTFPAKSIVDAIRYKATIIHTAQENRNARIREIKQKLKPINEVLDAHETQLESLDYHRSKKGKEKGRELLDNLKRNKDYYTDKLFSTENDAIALYEFKRSCVKDIDDAKLILENELGWADYLTNLAKALINMPIKVVTLGYCDSFFKPSASKPLDVINITQIGIVNLT